MKIWQRYIVVEYLKLITLFFLSFVLLYWLIDYATHLDYFSNMKGASKWGWIGLYYLCDFSRKLPLLLPFAFLFATIRLLTTMNQRGEMVALLIGGITKRAILTPLLTISFFGASLLYLNGEVFLPKALHTLELFKEKRVTQKNKRKGTLYIRHLILQDETPLLFKDYKHSTKTFEDLFWIRSIDEIWRIDRLTLGDPCPTCYHVEKFLRLESGEIALVDEIKKVESPEIVFNKKRLFETLTAPEERAISDLWQYLPSIIKVKEEKQAIFLSVFLHKIFSPLLTLFAVLLPAPYCMRFSRRLPVFFIYSLSLSVLVAFILLANASLLLGKQQVLTPACAICTPFLLAILFLLWNFKRLR